VADLAACHIRDEGQGVGLDVEGLGSLPEAAQRRLLRAAIERVRGTLTGVDYGHVEALRGLAGARPGGGRVDLPGLEARRSLGRLRLSKASVGIASHAPAGGLSLEPPGTFQLPGSNCLVRLKLRGCQDTFSGRADKQEGYNRSRQQALDWERLPKPLTLRGWLPGDRYQPWGRKRAKKLKSLFQEGRIAAWDRVSWPVITAPVPQASLSGPPGVPSVDPAGEVVVWAHEFGPAQQYAADRDSRTVLEITAVWSEREKYLEI
jgi:tRNA(Ile)-lysidine synthase